MLLDSTSGITLDGDGQNAAADYKTDYILVRQAWTCLDVKAFPGLNSSHIWMTLDGYERRGLVF
jgi:hypothetical protein